MGCACKVSRRIESIHRDYGEYKQRPKSRMKINIKRFVQQMLLLIFVMIPVSPILLIYILYEYYGKNNNKISVSKILNFLRRK